MLNCTEAKLTFITHCSVISGDYFVLFEYLQKTDTTKEGGNFERSELRYNDDNNNINNSYYWDLVMTINEAVNCMENKLQALPLSHFSSQCVLFKLFLPGERRIDNHFISAQNKTACARGEPARGSSGSSSSSPAAPGSTMTVRPPLTDPLTNDRQKQSKNK